MNFLSINNIIYRKFRERIIASTKNTRIYLYLYKSYWHMLFDKKKKLKPESDHYLTAIPNQGAGIGHQIANWIAGYWWAKKFNLKFAHTPFSTVHWEMILGFGNDEVNSKDLFTAGYERVRLPLFDENNEESKDIIKKIIYSYKDKNVCFVCEQDQGYRDQYGVMSNIQKKFYNTINRKKELIIYSPLHYNIAIHVRRGDIVVGEDNNKPNLSMRWQSNNYFINVLSNVKKIIKTEKPIRIFLFSQGDEIDFDEYKKDPDLKLCLEMNAYDSFIHMVHADLLITSKSSFSYKPALLNRGIKVCPKDFWHGYPSTEDWILTDNNGNLINIKN